MPKFALFFTIRPEALAGMMDHPSDRAAGLGKQMESFGGKLDAYYWMFGRHDGMVIADLPDSMTAAAAALAVSSTGAFGHVETHELIPADRINDVLDSAKKLLSGGYTPPGA
jgi:uncharacterized protein with GYD domain